ncbi:MAG: small, acid-soluble spore protein, alpha/beta type [Vallitaleaceae bacterium]|nr:small, acid-soluble spore protein, alpha/beta type [Vallitaleaceae bacterium]
MESNDKAAKKNEVPAEKPYMGNFTSEQIGSMAKAGQLGGEMAKRLVKEGERQLLNRYKEKG